MQYIISRSLCSVCCLFPNLLLVLFITSLQEVNCLNGAAAKWFPLVDDSVSLIQTPLLCFLFAALQGVYMRLPAATDPALQRHKHAADGHVRVPGSAHHGDTLRPVSVHTF